MIPYKKEDLVFHNMKTHQVHLVSNFYLRGGCFLYEIENQLTKIEKLIFIDELYNGAATHMLGTINKWEKESPNLPQTTYGDIKRNSEKAWIKRNNQKDLIEAEYNVGSYRLHRTLPVYNKLSSTTPHTDYGYSLEYTGEHIVYQWFHDVCKQLHKEETKYFKTIDSRSVKLQQVRDLISHHGTLLESRELNDIMYNGLEDVSEGKLDIYIDIYDTYDIMYKKIARQLELAIKHVD